MPYNYGTNVLMGNMNNFMGANPIGGMRNPTEGLDIPSPKEQQPMPAPQPQEQTPQPQQQDVPIKDQLAGLKTDRDFAGWAIKNGYMSPEGVFLKDDPTGQGMWKSNQSFVPFEEGAIMQALGGKKPTGKDSERAAKARASFFEAVNKGLIPPEEVDPESIIPDEALERNYTQADWDRERKVFNDPKASKPAREQAMRLIHPEDTEAFKREISLISNANTRNDLALDAIVNIRRLLDNNGIIPTVGFGSGVGSSIYGTDAKAMERYLNTLNANLVLDTLNELKSQSKTGATGFGALSEKELDLLLSAPSALSQGLSREEFVKALGDLENRLQERQAILSSKKDWTSPYARRRKSKQEEAQKPKQGKKDPSEMTLEELEAELRGE